MGKRFDRIPDMPEGGFPPLPPADDRVADEIYFRYMAVTEGQGDLPYRTIDERLAQLPPPTFPEDYDPAQPVIPHSGSEMEDGIQIRDHEGLAGAWDAAKLANKGIELPPQKPRTRELPPWHRRMLGSIGIGKRADK